MKHLFSTYLIVFALLLLNSTAFSQAYSIRDIKSYAFPSEVARTTRGDQIAVAINEQGIRNVYVGEAPTYKLRKLTNFQEDNGQPTLQKRL